MDTRVLTLFDDEDFLPQEEPSKKSKKGAPAKEPLNNNTSPSQEQEEQHIATAQSELNIPEAIPAATITVAAEMEQDVIDEPKNTVPEAIAEVPEEVVFPEEEQPEEEPLLHPEEDTVEEEIEADTETTVVDDDLDKQILSELIQTDYTALIHRDYPFEVSHASVVQPKKIVAEEELCEEENNVEENDEVFEDIVPLPEWNLDKKYYSIGEVASLFAVNTSHIRFWTNEFKIKPRTTRKGDRLYSPKDIAELRLIHHLVKEKKHTIKGAKEKLKAGKDDVSHKLDLKDSLKTLRDTLLQIKAQL